MDSQILLPFPHHQMAPSRMNHYDSGYQIADRSDRRQNSSMSSYSSRANSHCSSSNALSSIRTVERTQSPISSTNISRRTEEYQRPKSATNDAIHPNLRIPESINNSGGSLAEFAAQITCLFWFESTEILRIAEKSTEEFISSPASPPIKPLVREAIPAVGFRKWVVTILSTTQVTQNVIILALLFVYRLKLINPTVQGKVGSEYRLLTVALMLGNKFLDDNTYTNKTWAEVSGISVTEIHVMEVEFLSNMRYSLLASKTQWEEWHLKLRSFGIYFDRASRAPIPSPPGYRPPLLPSPPVSMQSSPPHLSVYPPTSSCLTHNHSYPHYSAPPISPLRTMPDLNPSLRPESRKRSYDDNSEEPPSKRIIHQLATPGHSSRIANRLPPMQPLTIPIREPMHPVSGNYSGVPHGTVLPPMNNRAMTSVYPTTPGYSQQHHPLLTPTGPQPPSHSISSTFNTPSRHQSPLHHPDLLSVGSSPISASFPRGSSFSRNSPGNWDYLRSSPYKPVRHVKTLLHPPPHISMQGLPTSAGQMHYQPLGKKNDYRSGIVPDYQSHFPQWHALPQPNFHA